MNYLKMICASVVLAACALSLPACANHKDGCGHCGEDGGCGEATCKEVKPGTITSVNTMCAVRPGDPVNPAITPIEWKGQKIGFCCKGCLPKWEKMTDTEKDAAVAKAIAMSVK